MDNRAIGRDRVYLAKRTTQWRGAGLCLVAGLLGLMPLASISRWMDGGPTPEPRMFLILLCLLGFPAGILFLINAVRGLPRLTIGTTGVTLQVAHATKWAHWDSLGPFTVKTTQTRRRKVKTASARISGPNARSGLWRAKTITLPDHFDKPLEAIAAELNTLRASSLGVAASDPLAVPEAAPVGLQGFTVPWLTLALLAVLIGVYVLELAFPVTASVKGDPSLPTLIAWGALSHTAILTGGEWYRLFTSALLHSSVAHIIGNGVALVFGGFLLERLVGRLWYVVFFAVSALGGSLVSLAIGPAELVSVGASGALMGMFAGLFVSSFRLPSGTSARVQLQVNSLRILVPSLLPFLSTAGGAHIDYGAHVGGALAGAALALVLRRSWPETALIPRGQQTAAIIAGVSLVLFVGSAGLVIKNYQDYDVGVIPQNEVPRTADQYRDSAASLAARYPDDPRSHLYLGTALGDLRDHSGAEREFRLAVTTAEAHAAVFGEAQALISRGILAGFLAEHGRQDEGKVMAWRSCQASDHEALKKMVAILTAQHLCD